MVIGRVCVLVCYTARTRSLFRPALYSLLFPRPDHTALWPMFSTPLPCLPAIAPEVSSTPEGLQATVVASCASDRLQRTAAEISSRSTTTTSFANASNPSAEPSSCFELCLHGTVVMSLKVTPAGACYSENLLSETRGAHTQREWLRAISWRSFKRYIARRLRSLPVVDRR